ncbi:hypothetical protein [Zavarzinella formosa]|uniref:hypothetical protein n=1 Tax=Zavarzinella formosa TaxID=360055 RepID=UPI0002EB9834|nr:hypothetical protein [Zavarzinella formosa]
MTTSPRTFADVPWHRKSGTMTVFILAGFCLFPPLLLAACVVCLTGDVYNDRRRRDGSLSRWSRLNKFAAVIILPVQVMVLAGRAGGTAGDLIALSGMGGWLLAIAVATVRMFRSPRAAPVPPPAVPKLSPEAGRPEQTKVPEGPIPAADGLFRLMNGDTPGGSYTESR